MKVLIEFIKFSFYEITKSWHLWQPYKWRCADNGGMETNHCAVNSCSKQMKWVVMAGKVSLCLHWLPALKTDPRQPPTSKMAPSAHTHMYTIYIYRERERDIYIYFYISLGSVLRFIACVLLWLPRMCAFCATTLASMVLTSLVAWFCISCSLTLGDTQKRQSFCDT